MQGVVNWALQGCYLGLASAITAWQMMGLPPGGTVGHTVACAAHFAFIISVPAAMLTTAVRSPARGH